MPAHRGAEGIVDELGAAERQAAGVDARRDGGGFIGREYALGRRRTDLLVHWQIPGGEQRVAIELKVSQGHVEHAIAAGLPQTWGYMDKCGAEGGSSGVIFDHTAGKPWEAKIFLRVVEY